MTVAEAYAVCRAIAKREAKNFYYAFRVLPKQKSDAMCAVYAFMRRADDISDDETKSVEQRREEMAEWVASWRAARSGAETDDAVFVALSDTQRRYSISDELLEQLVEGTAMDLEECPAGVMTLTATGPAGVRVKLQAYETFADLYRYCYLVASVVGLVCIRIFGYSDPAAELLAERTGVAFQLTNILRDVKEDAERGRVYIPQDMLHEFEVSNEDVLELARGRELKANERALIAGLSVQAWEYYEAARQLIPLLDADSRAAMWVLVEIYSGLLKKIDQREGDVFSERVSVPTGQKIFALVRGAAMAVRGRRG
jgi:15-cis-phytoene synthase